MGWRSHRPWIVVCVTVPLSIPCGIGAGGVTAAGPPAPPEPVDGGVIYDPQYDTPSDELPSAPSKARTRIAAAVAAEFETVPGTRITNGYPMTSTYCSGSYYDQSVNADGDVQITRDEIERRAMSWFTGTPVAYCTAHAWRNKYGQYRTDCSGFLAMAWHTKLMYPTGQLYNYPEWFPDIDYTVGWNALKKGDALVRDGHIVLFLEYPGGDKSQIMYIHQTGFGGGVEISTKTVAYLRDTQHYRTMRYKRATDVPPPPLPILDGFTGTADGATSTSLTVPPRGGTVRLDANVRNATTVTFTGPASLGLPRSVSVSSGAASYTLNLPPNTTVQPTNYSLTVSVSGPGGTITPASGVRVTVQPQTASSMVLWDQDSGAWKTVSWADFVGRNRQAGTWTKGYTHVIPGDWDANGKANDVLIWNVNNGTWVTQSFSSNFAPTYKNSGTWSTAYYNATPGDWDGDGRVDDLFIWGQATYDYWAVHAFTNFAPTLRASGDWSNVHDHFIAAQWAG